MDGVIIAGGYCPAKELVTPYLKNNAFLVCADHGYDYARQMGFTPNLIVGDMDSLQKEIDSIHTKILRYPTKKNHTDLELALHAAIRHGCTKITVFGAIGSRMDHTIANILLLKKCIRRQIQGCLISENNQIYLTSSFLRLTGKPGDLISLIPLENSSGITTKNLAYPLNNESLSVSSTRGISNYFTADFMEVSVTAGILLIIKAKD